jgi:hypothetical protein
MNVMNDLTLETLLKHEIRYAAVCRVRVDVQLAVVATWKSTKFQHAPMSLIGYFRHFRENLKIFHKSC